MKLKVLFSILLLTFYFTLSAQQKPRVAVYVTGDNPINEIVGSSLEDGLAHDGKYTAVERTASFLRELSKEHDYQRSGEVDESQIADLGKQFGVEYVCVTSVTDVWGNEKYISARIIDVQTAEVIASGSSNGSISSSSDLVRVLDKLSQNILRAMNISRSTKTSKVAIYVTKTGNKDVDVILGDQLVAGFASSGKYLAIERTSRFLSEIKKEQGYQQSGAVDDDELTKLGQKFGVQYVCVAKTTKWGGDYFISTRLIDVKTGEIVNSSNAQGKKLNNSQNVVDVATEIAQKLSGRTINEEAEWQKREQQRKIEEAKREEQRKQQEKEAAKRAEQARIQELVNQPWTQLLKKVTENVTIRYSDGGCFIGRKVGWSGYGMSVLNDGTIYCGNYALDDGVWKKNYSGMYIVPEGYYITNCPESWVYVGDYSDGDMEDDGGTIYNRNGNMIYCGKFKRGKPKEEYPQSYSDKYQFKVINFDNGDKYVGETRDGEKHGKGLYIWVDGDAWYGQFTDGKRNGKGIAMFYKGGYIIGKWQDDKLVEKLFVESSK